MVKSIGGGFRAQLTRGFLGSALWRKALCGAKHSAPQRKPLTNALRSLRAALMLRAPLSRPSAFVRLRTSYTTFTFQGLLAPRPPGIINVSDGRSVSGDAPTVESGSRLIDNLGPGIGRVARRHVPPQRKRDDTLTLSERGNP